MAQGGMPHVIPCIVTTILSLIEFEHTGTSGTKAKLDSQNSLLQKLNFRLHTATMFIDCSGLDYLGHHVSH